VWDVDRMTDEMRPEQLMEWMAYLSLKNESDRPAAYTDPKDQEAVLKRLAGF